MESFPFRFSRFAARTLPLFGIRHRTSAVVIDNGELLARFGRVRVATTLDNVLDAQVTGPYSWLKALGVRVSMADRGLTFGSNTQAGVCLRFHRPVEGVMKRFGLRHPGLTVTVADPDALVRCIEALRPSRK